MKSHWPILILLSITFLAYRPTLNHGFTNWDDEPHLVENPSVRLLSYENIKTIFRDNVNLAYIPLTTLSFAFEYHFVGHKPFIYHLDNVLLHVDGSYEKTVFNELARTDTEYTFAAGARYLINEYLFAGLRLSRVDRDSAGGTLEYTDNRAMVYFGVKLCCTDTAQRQRGGP